MAEQPHDDGRNAPAQAANEEEKAKAAGATAATGAGCLFTALMPWSLIIVVLVIIAVAYVIWGFLNGPGPTPA